ncbi:hypothetical protein ABIF91_001595 [Bradyrhizobium sp. USDA 241]
MNMVKIRLMSCIGAAVLSSASSLAYGQAAPKQLSEASVLNEAQTIKQAGLLKLAKPFEVSVNTRFDGWFIVADRVVFKSGSQLIFTRQALQNRRNFFIVANELVSEDSNSPGVITYEQAPVDAASAKPGQGPSGPPGAGDGDSGHQGGPGEPGNPGPKGFSAPALTITVMKVPGSGPAIDMRGGQGGEGGQGQKGGDGGAGRQGSPASLSMVDCKAGGGRGGNGGTGGTAGKGGVGGNGGDGGSVTIIAPPDLLPSLSQKFRVLVSGGQPGNGGPPGAGGNPGPAGAGGQEAKPYCGGGPGGSGGTPGATNARGDVGKPGVDGDFFVGAITPELFAQISK